VECREFSARRHHGLEILYVFLKQLGVTVHVRLSVSMRYHGNFSENLFKVLTTFCLSTLFTVISISGPSTLRHCWQSAACCDTPNASAMTTF